jgi:hypothetical protein
VRDCDCELLMRGKRLSICGSFFLRSFMFALERVAGAAQVGSCLVTSDLLCGMRPKLWRHDRWDPNRCLGEDI